MPEQRYMRVFEVERESAGRRGYVATLLAWSPEDTRREARTRHGNDVIVTDVSAERRRAREAVLFTEGSSTMKKDEVKVGGTYVAKVSDKLVPVRLDSENAHGGWDGTNLKTGKKVRVKSAQRLRAEVKPIGEAAAQEAPTPTTGAQGESKPARKSKGGKKGQDAPPAATGGDGKMSGLDAAAKVLADANEPLSCKQLVERAFEKGYWASDGKTPWATIYSAILREIQQKGDQARFRKAARGKFEIAK